MKSPAITTASEYQQLAYRTSGVETRTFQQNLENFSLGLFGETGEIIEVVKKARYHGKPELMDNLLGEFGDLYWYSTMILGLFNLNHDAFIFAAYSSIEAAASSLLKHSLKSHAVPYTFNVAGLIRKIVDEKLINYHYLPITNYTFNDGGPSNLLINQMTKSQLQFIRDHEADSLFYKKVFENDFSLDGDFMTTLCRQLRNCVASICEGIDKYILTISHNLGYHLYTFNEEDLIFESVDNRPYYLPEHFRCAPNCSKRYSIPLHRRLEDDHFGLVPKMVELNALMIIACWKYMVASETIVHGHHTAWTLNIEKLKKRYPNKFELGISGTDTVGGNDAED